MVIIRGFFVFFSLSLFLKMTVRSAFFTCENKHSLTELQIIGDTEDNSKIIFLISQRKHML